MSVGQPEPASPQGAGIVAPIQGHFLYDATTRRELDRALLDRRRYALLVLSAMVILSINWSTTGGNWGLAIGLSVVELAFLAAVLILKIRRSLARTESSWMWVEVSHAGLRVLRRSLDYGQIGAPGPGGATFTAEITAAWSWCREVTRIPEGWVVRGNELRFSAHYLPYSAFDPAEHARLDRVMEWASQGAKQYRRR